MNRYIKKIVALFAAVVLALGSSATAFADTTAASAYSVGALLDSYTASTNGETFTLTKTSRIFVVSDEKPSGDYLQTVQLIHRQFSAMSDFTLELVWGAKNCAVNGDIVLCVDKDSGISTEGYQLDVGSIAVITAADNEGLIYGANTLMKCFRAVGGTSLSGFTATDTPDTKQRVVMLDCGRKYLTAEWIKNFIRQISWMGYNALELHFSEDGGFRADFWDKDYYTDNYNPKNDFSWLCGSKVQYWVYNGNKNDSSYTYSTDPDAGKYLTTKELVEICNVANEYHIEIIPSFDSPAHMDYITWKFEQNYENNKSYYFSYGVLDYYASAVNGCINYTGTTGSNFPNWYYAAVDIRENTVAEAFVLALYNDIADFFKEYAGSYNFSIGADEVGQGSSVKWTYAKDFPIYINKLNGILNEKGYTVRMFNDFIGTTAYSTDQAFNSNIQIMYWDSPFNPNTNENNGNTTSNVDKFIKEGRTIYNCIQTHTYHVLRIANSSKATTKYTDARNPANRQWTFYHSTEDLIYTEWVPNDVREIGEYPENNQIIPTSQLGGAYFLIWNDYASVSTEYELWNGAPDNTGTNNGVTYYLFDRMWSNIIKMWNSDINNTVTYDSFAAVRKTFGYFPGYTSCSAAASLSGAVEPSTAVDKTALAAALNENETVDPQKFTTASYNVYKAAYDNAVSVNKSKSATQAQVDAALNELKQAKSALVLTDSTGRITIKLMVEQEEAPLKTLTFKATSYNAVPFSAYIGRQNGYTFVSASSGYTFTPLASNDGSGFITGYAKAGDTITLTYKNAPNTAYLEALLNDAYTESSFDFTDGSWKNYQNVIDTIKSALKTKQSDVDALAEQLISVSNALVTSGDAEIVNIARISSATQSGKRMTLQITTSSAVSSLSVAQSGSDISLNTCLSKLQRLSNGSIVKVWLIGFTAPPASSEEVIYTISANDNVVSTTFGVTVID